MRKGGFRVVFSVPIPFNEVLRDFYCGHRRMVLTITYKWLAVVLAGLLSVVLAFLIWFSWSRTDSAIVSFTFDDASNTQYDQAFRITQSYGLPGTLFVPTEMVNMSERGEGYEWTMGWDRIREISAAGWEIGSHSRTHTRLRDLSPDQVKDELRGSRLEIEAQTGIAPMSFSSPFGNFDDDVIAQVMDVYDFHLSWKGHRGRNPGRGFERRFIGRFEVENDMTAAQVCGEMVKAAEADTWLVLLFHGIVEGEAEEYEVSTDVFEEIVACAGLLQAQGLIRVETVRDAVEILDWRRNLPFWGRQRGRDRG